MPLTKQVAAGCKMSHLIGKSHCLPALALEKNANKGVGDMVVQRGMPQDVTLYLNFLISFNAEIRILRVFSSDLTHIRDPVSGSECLMSLSLELYCVRQRIAIKIFLLAFAANSLPKTEQQS